MLFIEISITFLAIVSSVLLQLLLQHQENPATSTNQTVLEKDNAWTKEKEEIDKKGKKLV